MKYTKQQLQELFPAAKIRKFRGGFKLVSENDVVIKNNIDNLIAIETQGDVYIYGTAKVPALTSIVSQGYVSISGTANALTSIEAQGYVSIYGTANALTSIVSQGYVSISGTANALTSIEAQGYVSIYGTANALTSIEAQGNVYISGTANVPALTSIVSQGYVSISGTAKVPALTSIVSQGNVYIYGTANALTSIVSQGYVYISGTANVPALTSIVSQKTIFIRLSNAKIEQLMFERFPDAEFILDENSEYLVDKDIKNVEYKIFGNDVSKELYQDIMLDRLSTEQVFKIENAEIRRVAYEKMDKVKMKGLKNYKVLDEKVDGNNNPMKIISFGIDGFDEPFLYYECVCPSTGREYFLETQETECNKAKMKSFGLDKNIKFDEEW